MNCLRYELSPWQNLARQQKFCIVFVLYIDMLLCLNTLLKSRFSDYYLTK